MRACNATILPPFLPPEVLSGCAICAMGLEGGVNGIIEDAAVKALEILEAAYQKEHEKPVPVRPGAKLEGA